MLPLMFGMSPFSTTAGALKNRFLLVFFFVFRCCLPCFLRRTLPFPVTLKRFAAAFLVLSLYLLVVTCFVEVEVLSALVSSK